MRGVQGTLVARRTVEVDCGHGLRKRYVIGTWPTVGR
jgi:hypothetical protein